ncbi:signal peptidase I [Staphylococcus warneri]|jgi:signal peptidase I|uniref:signal peptidase I n=1 Tax=Staphylococcus warneri TaxID=1292 RepID=UPI0001A5C631|nr:signal peptidase I [Staphylococcus warneri]EEQ79588.1 signal peptidase I [Staphylococcus warneri L37603]MBO0377728.1 signal peptidase I [Staphylococcus warneri]MCJ1805189.1 signal peptidase I [Staphylococcus warneri]QKI07908.1 signal peptidase I [Staphylococcus warneri]
MGKEMIEWIVALAKGIIIAIILTVFIGTSYTVSGESMHPTFEDKDKVIVSKISKTLNHIDSGDVIIFHANSKSDYIKRLIGKPGDTVKYKKDQLYINDKKVKESYLSENKKYKDGKYLTEDFNSKSLNGANGKAKIPADKYLVLGDNRQNSNDSRYKDVGLIDKKQIVGKVMFRYWPFDKCESGFNPGTFPN